MNDADVPRVHRVVDRIDEGADTVTLVLEPVDGVAPAFEPAQISMLGAFGIGEAAISISSAPTDEGARAYTVRRAGPITRALTVTDIGGIITVRGPLGRPWPLEQITTRDVVVLAGGLGMAPLRSAVEVLAGTGDRFRRRVLVQGARNPDGLLYRRDHERWAEAGIETHTIVDDPAGDAADTPRWSGAVGMVTDLFDELGLDGPDTTALVCGPDPMMRATARRLVELGVEPSRIWLTLERNMQCGTGVCGHCQLGPVLVCRHGPVMSWAEIGPFHGVRGL